MGVFDIAIALCHCVLSLYGWLFVEGFEQAREDIERERRDLMLAKCYDGDGLVLFVRGGDVGLRV